jgi:nucleotide-binding universal stress UspA family protein
VQDHDDREDGSSALRSAQAALGDFPGHVTTATGHGSSTSEVVDVLLYTADYVNADLIAVGASGNSAIARFFLGSVAESVARHARYPVLVTRSQSGPLREVIVAVDGSDCSHRAAEFAATQLPLPPDCTLRLAHVVPQPIFGVEGDPSYPGTPAYQTLNKSNQEARNKARVRLEEIAGRLRSTNPEHTIVVEPVVMGNPAVELVRIANQHSAGLIVVGSKGVSGIERFLLGSVSERVLRHAPCSVLIVK